MVVVQAVNLELLEVLVELTQEMAVAMAEPAVTELDMAEVVAALADTMEMVVMVLLGPVTVREAQTDPAVEVAAVPLDTEAAAEAALEY